MTWAISPELCRPGPPADEGRRVPPPRQPSRRGRAVRRRARLGAGAGEGGAVRFRRSYMSPMEMADVHALDRFVPETWCLLRDGPCSPRLERLYALAAFGAFFVIRAKSNTRYQRRYSRPVDKTTGLRCDQTIVLTAADSTSRYLQRLGPSPLGRSAARRWGRWRLSSRRCPLPADGGVVSLLVSWAVGEADPAARDGSSLDHSRCHDLHARRRACAGLEGVVGALRRIIRSRSPVPAFPAPPVPRAGTRSGVRSRLSALPAGGASSAGRPAACRRSSLQRPGSRLRESR